MAKNPYIRPKSRMTGKTTGGHKSAGILDDYAVRKNIDTREGTITRTPVNANDIVNKAYVDAQSHLPVKLNEVENPDASKTFNLGNNKFINWTSVDRTPIAGEGIFNWECSGNFTGDLCHIHQHTGNAGADTNLLKIESEDSDATCLTLVANNAADNAINITTGNIAVSGTVDGIDIATDVAANTTHRGLTNNPHSTTVEGTAVLSTGPVGATNFLRADGDGTCSWQVPAGAGDVTAGANLTDETLVQGDGGAKGIKTTTVTAAEVAANTLKDTNVTTNLSLGAVDATTMVVASSDGTDCTLIEADTTDAGLLGSDKWDEIVANTAASHAEAHSVASHNDTTGTGAELDTLTDGSDASALHVHTVVSLDTDTTGAELTDLGDNSMVDALHRHSELSASDGTPDAAVSLDAAGVMTTSIDAPGTDTAYMANVLYNTDDTPPAAGGFPVGTIYIQYTN